MPFIPHTDNDIRTMLDAIGAPDIDALFEENRRTCALPACRACRRRSTRWRSAG